MINTEKQLNRKVNREKTKKRTKQTWMTLGILTFLLVFGRLLWGMIGVNIRYGDGERIAKVIKIAEKGLIWKTWEAEGVLTQGNFSVTYVWKFSVDNFDPNKDKVLSDIKQAFETGQTVKIHYDQRAGHVPWRSETTYFAKKVRFE